MTPSSYSGPRVARLFRVLFALVSLSAWWSLAVQVEVLVGSRGLLPAAAWLERLEARLDPSFFEVPTLFVWNASDAALRAGVVAGMALSVFALLSVFPRLCFALSTLLYLSYAVVCRNFLAFQWDNLLIECGVLAALLPQHRPAPWLHLLFRVLLFKLYFESGLAKWQSHLGDWHDGSAMTFYYETAPIPTALAPFFHSLPEAWHHFESRATLAWELVVPFAIFLPRPFRLGAAACFTGFQLLNLASANYGFFCCLALALHVFLLSEDDVRRAARFGRRTLRRIFPGTPRTVLVRCRSFSVSAHLARQRFASRLARVRRQLWPRRFSARFPLARVRRSAAAFFGTALILLSIYTGMRRFSPSGPQLGALDELVTALAPFRVVNVYHLFGHITRDRYEPEFQTLEGNSWTPRHLHYKPGPVERAPPFVAPHQPRVDFLLWFYGLGVRDLGPGALGERFRAPQPQHYVASLLEHLCSDPEAVDSLFASRLPERPRGVRIVFYRYRFSSPDERERTGKWWTRTKLTETPAYACESLRG